MNINLINSPASIQNMDDETYYGVILQGVLGKQIEQEPKHKKIKPLSPQIKHFYQQHQSEIESLADKVKEELSFRGGEHGTSHYVGAFVREFPQYLKAELLREAYSLVVHQCLSLDVAASILAFETQPYKDYLEEAKRIRNIDFSRMFPELDD